MPTDNWLVISAGKSGILRREPRRGACIRWACGVVDGSIVERDMHDDYSVLTIGWGGPEDRMTVIVCTELAAAVEGYDISQVPLYPHPDQPYVEHKCGPGCGTTATPGHTFHCGCRQCGGDLR